jgi:GH24 family phage-related lysozyme (muramidase)
VGDYRKYFDPLIKSVEGHSNDSYSDSNGNPTIGAGMNLNDPTIQGLMSLRGIDHNDVKSGNRSIANDELADIQNAYLGSREKLVRNKVGGDLYDTLQPHEKAAIMSMGYQSLNNLGPSLSGHLASGDKPNAIKEMLLNTNAKKDPGILSRRFQEAQTYDSDPVSFSSAFKIMSDDEKKQLADILGKTKNENTRKELLDKYGSYLGTTQPKQDFSKLTKLINTASK